MRKIIFILFALFFCKPAFAAGSCACPTLTLKCLPPMEFNTACGVVEGASVAACTHDTSYAIDPCTVFMKEDDCTRLGLNPLTSVDPSVLTMNCAADYIDATSVNPEHDLEVAKKCCILQHELTHVTDSVCGVGDSPACNEAPAYEDSNACMTDVANAFCSNFADNSEDLNIACQNACDTQIWDLETAYATKCICDQQKSGVTDQNEILANCAEKCTEELSPDDIAVECQDAINNDDNIEETTTTVVSNFCENGFSSSSSSSSSTSSESSSEESSSSSSISSESSSEESSSSSSISSESSSEESSSSSSYSSEF